MKKIYLIILVLQIFSFNVFSQAITGLRPSNIRLDGFTLNWNPINGSNVTYRVWINGIMKPPISNTYIDITGLNSHQGYNAQVEAYQNNVRVGLSPVITVFTNSLNATIFDISINGFSVNWNLDAPDTSIVLFNVWVDGILKHNHIMGTEAYILGQYLFENHNVQIEAYHNQVRIGLSSVISLYNLNITTEEIGSTSFSLIWTGINDPVTYNVWLNGYLYTTTSSADVAITDLNPDQSYNVQIEAYSGSTRIGLSPVITVVTAALKSDPVVLNNDEPSKKLIISPNPTDGILAININETSTFEVTIYTITGNKINSYQNLKKIDISNLPSGNYIVSIKLNNTQIIQKIIKK
jgi:hypothetical protein